MPTSTRPGARKPEAAARRRILIRVTPEIRQALKVAAAEKGVFMEDLLHALLCRGLDRRDLLDRPPIKGERAS